MRRIELGFPRIVSSRGEAPRREMSVRVAGTLPVEVLASVRTDDRELSEQFALDMVRAVNSHDELLSSLRSLLDYVGNGTPGGIFDDARAAIARAEGES